LTFAASADAGGDTAVAAPVTVLVDPVSKTTVAGRVVDADGLPVRGAVVELLSTGVRADFFRLGAPVRTLPDLTGLAPDSSTRVTAINQRNPGFVFGADPFGAGLAPDYGGRLTGWINIATAGVHTFVVGAAEGVRLEVGGTRVIDRPAGTGVFQESAANINLSVGLVPIALTFYASQGSGELQLSFVPPNGERVVVAPSMLLPDPSALTVTTDESGLFEFAGVPIALGSVHVRAEASANGQSISAESDVVSPIS